jgi:hypothetical protein
MTRIKDNPLLWETVVERKRELQAGKLAPYLDRRAESSITSVNDVEQLTKMIEGGGVTAEAIITNYIYRYDYHVSMIAFQMTDGS